MFKRMLVPLDGSPLAESVLPAATYLAEHLDATIILFHAIEQGAAPTIHGQRHLQEVNEASAYLDQVVSRITRPGIRIEKNVHPVQEAHVARSIVEHVTELDADLILLCAHGSGGLRGVLVGSIAQQVIQHGTTPVFFIRPTEDRPNPSFQCHKILIPLDSTPNHEPALPVAVELAQEFGAGLDLLTVVPTAGTLSAERAATGMLLPTTTTAVLELAQRDAVEYLAGIRERLAKQGLATSASVARGDPPAASAVNRGLVLLGKPALGRVPEFVSQGAHVRILLVVVEQDVGMDIVSGPVGISS